MTPVPNRPKTPIHSFRCEDDLWDSAKEAAEANGETLTAVLRRALQRYAKRHAPK